MAAERHDVAFVVGAVLGGVAGAAATLLNAPQSGARTRAQLVEQVQMMVNGAGTTPTRLRVEDRARHMMDLTERATASATATVSGFISRAPDPTAASRADASVTPLTEPVALLPGPLEPDPIVEAARTGAPPEIDETRDIVLDGPRPAGADQERLGERL